MRRIAIIDVSIILGVSAFYVLMEAFHVQKRWSFLAIGTVILLYGVHLYHRRTESWRDLGFRTDNLGAGLLPVSLFTGIASLGILWWAITQGRTPWRKDLAVLLLLYPVWGVTQQAIFQGLLHRRLMLLTSSPFLPVAVTSLAFAAVHAGNFTLVTLTFGAGLVWSILFRRWPNVWLLGASHAILAALAYPLVLNDAPLSRW